MKYIVILLIASHAPTLVTHSPRYAVCACLRAASPARLLHALHHVERRRLRTVDGVCVGLRTVGDDVVVLLVANRQLSRVVSVAVIRTHFFRRHHLVQPNALFRFVVYCPVRLPSAPTCVACLATTEDYSQACPTLPPTPSARQRTSTTRRRPRPPAATSAATCHRHRHQTNGTCCARGRRRGWGVR